MPRKKRSGQTQVSVQVPDELLAAIDRKRGKRSRNAYLCELAAADTGTAYSPRPKGRPPKTEPKPAKPTRKPKGEK